MSNEDDKTQKIEIKVDNKGTEKLVEILEKERAEKQQQKPEFDLADKKIQVYQKFGDAKALDCNTKEELAQFVADKVRQASEQFKPKPSGSAIANEAQYGIKPESLWTKKYYGDTKEEQFKNMIQDLRQQARNGSKEAESYLKSLYEQYWNKAKDTRIEYKPSVEELGLVKQGDNVVATNETELQRMFRMWREERLKRMGIKGEEQK